MILAGIIAYIVLQLGIGLAVSRGIRSETDYLVAGRRIGLPLVAFSMFATWFGAETCISASGKFYDEGLFGGTTDPFGYALALFVFGIFLAAPLWRKGLTTLADLFRERFSPGVERFAALMMIPTSVFWAAAQIRAFGQVLDATSGFGVTACVTFAAVVVIVYTCTGGLMADVVTDLIQGAVIIVGLVVVFSLVWASGEIRFTETWRELDPEKLRWFGAEGVSRWEVVELWALTIGGSIVAQELVMRSLGARSASVARNGALLGGGIYLSVGLIPAFLGLMGAQLLPGLENPEHFLPKLAQRFLPPVLFVLFAGALVSAILSTVDSTLLAASSLASHNFLASLKPDLTDRQKLRAARVGVAVFGLIAYGLALGAERIFDLVQQANGVGSAGICVLLIGGLFTRFGGVRAGFAALTAGLGVWIYGTYVGAWACTYLLSLAAAVAGYVVFGMMERRSRSVPTTICGTDASC